MLKKISMRRANAVLVGAGMLFLAGFAAIAPAKPEDAVAQLDLFDRLQLQSVIAVCRHSSTLSDAGRKLRLRGRGLAGTPPGDQIVEVEITAPRATNEEQREAYRELAKAFDDSN